MPRIRVYEANQVGPAPTTRSRYAPADFSQSAGAALAEGMQTIGRTMGSVAIDLDKVQELADDTESRKLTLQYQERAASVLAAYGEAEGENVLAADKEARGELDKLATELVGMSTNDRMRKMTDERINQLRTAHRVQITETSAQKVKASADRTQKSQILVAKEEFVRAAFQDPAIAAKYLLTGQDLLEDQADLLGWSDEEFALKSIEQESSWHLAVFDQLMANDDIDAAMAYRDAHKDRLTAEHTAAMANDLKNPLLTRQAASDAAEAMGQSSPVEALRGGGKYSLPVKGGTVTSRYGAPRAGRAPHNGLDIAAPAGTPINPVAGGTVIEVASDGVSGNYVVIDHGNGLTTSYAHMQKHGVRVGDKVGPGSVLGTVGSTGRSTGPHVHLVARQGRSQIDPMSLVGKDAPGGNAARRWDKEAAYKAIDARKDWSFERRQRAKQWVDDEIARDEGLKARDEQDADREASKIVLDLGENFTSLNQIPADVRARLSPDVARQYQNNAEVNKGRRDAGRVIHNNSDPAVELKLLASENPEAFAQVDLSKFVAYISPSDRIALTEKQQKILRDVPKAANAAGAISSTISLYSTPDMGLTGPEQDKAQYLAVHSTMSALIEQQTGGKRAATDAELRSAYEQATREVVLPKVRTFLGMEAGGYDVRKPLHQLSIKDVPQSERTKIVAALRSFGTPNPTEAQIVEVYRNRLAKRK